MVHEFALDPELVASWGDRLHGRIFIDKFGFGTGRVVSRYPKSWQRRVWEAFENASAAPASEIERTRVEVLLKSLTEPMVHRRACVWDNTCSWLENAEREHERRPFHAILSSDNPRDHLNIVREDDILDGTPEAWDTPSSIDVERNATSMADAVRPMLGSATQILFVDPHFDASERRYRNSLDAFLRLVRTEEPRVTIELHTGNVRLTPDWNFFKKQCERFLPARIPAGLNLIVHRWMNRTSGAKLHNRYILTDIGGVQFGTGLDEGSPGATDDVVRLDTDVYRQRMENYTGDSPAFDLEGKVSILGTRRS